MSYYLKNLILNWNVAAFLVPFAVPLSALNYICSWKASEEHKKWGIRELLALSGQSVLSLCSISAIHPSYWRHYSALFLLFASFSVWCLIFFSQPHKEERFLFPVYPLIALMAAVSLDSVERYSL